MACEHDNILKSHFRLDKTVSSRQVRPIHRKKLGNQQDWVNTAILLSLNLNQLWLGQAGQSEFIDDEIPHIRWDELMSLTDLINDQNANEASISSSWPSLVSPTACKLRELEHSTTEF